MQDEENSMCEASGHMTGHTSFMKKEKPPITTERRRYLLGLANTVVDSIIMGCEEHERRLLMHFIEAQFQEYRR